MNLNQELKTFEWLEPWTAASNSAQLEAELARELNAQHPLFNLKSNAVAEDTNTKDVLFYLPDNSAAPLAVVSLTHAGVRETSAEFPATVFYYSLADFVKERMTIDYLNLHPSSDALPDAARFDHAATTPRTNDDNINNNSGGGALTSSALTETAEPSHVTARRSSMVYAAVMSLVLTIIVCLVAGLAADKYFGTSYGVVVGIVIGAIVGFYQFMRLMNRAQ